MLYSNKAVVIASKPLTGSAGLRSSNLRESVGAIQSSSRVETSSGSGD